MLKHWLEALTKAFPRPIIFLVFWGLWRVADLSCRAYLTFNTHFSAIYDFNTYKSYASFVVIHYVVVCYVTWAVLTMYTFHKVCLLGTQGYICQNVPHFLYLEREKEKWWGITIEFRNAYARAINQCFGKNYLPGMISIYILRLWKSVCRILVDPVLHKRRYNMPL
jgi:hypothetical protein